MRVSVTHHAEVEKSATAKERFSQSPHVTMPTKKNWLQNPKLTFLQIKNKKIYLQPGSDDFRVYCTLEECSKANLDVVCIQEECRFGCDFIEYLGYNLNHHKEKTTTCSWNFKSQITRYCNRQHRTLVRKTDA